MQENVLLKIEGRQWSEEGDPEEIRLMTEGRLFRRDSAWIVIYEESEATGMEGIQTTLMVDDDGTVFLSRSGAQRLDLSFTAGTRHITRMEMPFGHLDVELYTSLVKSQLTEDGGYIQLGYSIDLNRHERMNTRLNVQIRRLPA